MYVGENRIKRTPARAYETDTGSGVGPVSRREIVDDERASVARDRETEGQQVRKRDYPYSQNMDSG